MHDGNEVFPDNPGIKSACMKRAQKTKEIAEMKRTQNESNALRGSLKQLHSESGLGEETDPGSEPSKRCTKCGKTKPLSDYYNNRAAHDGKQARCAECIKAYDKEYRADEGNRKAKKAYLKSYHERKRAEAGKPYHCVVEVLPEEAVVLVKQSGELVMVHAPISPFCEWRLKQMEERRKGVRYA